MTALSVIATGYDEGSPEARAARSGRAIAEYSEEGSELVGHVTIGIYSDGRYSCGYNMPENHAFLGSTMFCAMVKEIIQRELTGKLAADDYAKEYLT